MPGLLLLAGSLVVAGCEQTVQEVSGVVVDCPSGAVVPGASLRLVGWRDYWITAGPPYAYTGSADAEGRFRMAHDRPVDHLEAVAPGYRTAHVHDLRRFLRVRLLPGDGRQVSYDCRPAEHCLQSISGADGSVEIRNVCLDGAQ